MTTGHDPRMVGSYTEKDDCGQDRGIIMSEVRGSQNNWSAEMPSFCMARAKGSHEGLDRSQVREKWLSG